VNAPSPGRPVALIVDDEPDILTLNRMVLEQAEHADSGELALLEGALQLLMQRFQAMEGDSS